MIGIPTLLVVGLGSVVSLVGAQQAGYAQCGGKSWTGGTTCVSGFVCVANGEYYSQCVPGTGPAPSPPTPTTSTGGGGGGGQVPLPTNGPGTTLQNGYYWIRAVASPNFHKYLQTKPIYTPGVAILDSYTTAGQFAVVDGQLTQLVTGGLLYATVEKFTDGAVKLAVSFGKEKNSYGTFMWSGDALQWSVEGVKRQNLSAWLVCANQALWVNLGAYGYMTPAGCVDQTIHYYNDKTANG